MNKEQGWKRKVFRKAEAYKILLTNFIFNSCVLVSEATCQTTKLPNYYISFFSFENNQFQAVNRFGEYISNVCFVLQA